MLDKALLQVLFVIVKAPPRVCMKNTALARGGESSVVLFIHTSMGSALIVILYLLVVLLGATFSSTRIAAIFAYQDVSECLKDLSSSRAIL